jgi:hypothetical protein
MESDAGRTLLSVGSAGVREARQWSSVVVSHTILLEHAAVDIHTGRVLYHLDLELAEPLPSALLAHAEYLCLSWHLGGIWKIRRVSDDNRKVHCQSWRRTDLSRKQVNKLSQQLEKAKRRLSNPGASSEDNAPPNLFEWKMQLGTWGNNKSHWFLRDIRPPKTSGRVRRGESAGLMSNEELVNVPIVAQLLVGFSPLEVQLEVNSITTVETVAQTFSADVTWQVTIPAITAIREDSIVRELLDILEIDASQFEFTNVNATLEERDVATSMTLAGEAEFVDATLERSGLQIQTASVKVNHLQFSRRVIAVFSEEMSLYYFPFDQQKLTFDFSTGGGVRESMKITPASVDAGSFAIENYKLGNVFDAVYQDKVFIGTVDDSGKKKTMTFELMLERRSGYYLTNVGIPSACITYLCFISYAPLSSGSLMETDARLQIVLTLLLTAVTFKNQVAALIPQVSYFTWIDKYVFFCFVVACLVALENALFPLFQDLIPEESWSEQGLLGFSFGTFTLINLVWVAATAFFVKRRQYAAKVLLQVHEFSRAVSAGIPSDHREAVLHEYLNEAGFPKWALPPLVVSHSGDIFVQLPDDSPHDTQQKAKRALKDAEGRQAADEKLQKIFQRLNSTTPGRPSALSSIPPAPPSAVESGEGRHSRRQPSIAPEDLALEDPYHKMA